MAAEIKPRIDFEGRTRLETVIPLSTPYLVFLDPSSACNAKCKWCPTGSGRAEAYYNPGVMQWILYKKIIADLAAMPEPVKTLRLYKDGEPLLNDSLPKMVAHAKSTRRFKRIDTTTNGILLTPSKSRALAESGLDVLIISVPQRWTKQYLSRVKYFYEASAGRTGVYCKIIGDGLSQTEKDMFMESFFGCCDRIFIENLSPCWPEFTVNGVQRVGIYGQPVTEPPNVCPYIFYSMAINSDGSVSLCFLDWMHGVIVGNAARESIAGIWSGHKLRSYQYANLRGMRKCFPLCDRCGQLEYGAPDNIDTHTAKILENMENAGAAKSRQAAGFIRQRETC